MKTYLNAAAPLSHLKAHCCISEPNCRRTAVCLGPELLQSDGDSLHRSSHVPGAGHGQPAGQESCGGGLRLASLPGPHPRRRGEMFYLWRDLKLLSCAAAVQGPAVHFPCDSGSANQSSGLFPLPGWDGSLERLDNSHLQLRGASVESKQLIFLTLQGSTAN